MSQENIFDEVEAKLNAVLRGLQELGIPDVTKSDYIDAAANSVGSENLTQLRKKYVDFYSPVISSIRKLFINLRKTGFTNEINPILDSAINVFSDLSVRGGVRIFGPSESEAKKAVVELRFYVKKILLEDLPRIKRLLSNLESDKTSILNYLVQSFPKAIRPSSAIGVIESINTFFLTRPAVLEDQKVRIVLNKYVEQLLRAVFAGVNSNEMLFNISAMRSKWNSFFRMIETGSLDAKKTAFSSFFIVLKDELVNVEKRKVGIAPIEDAKKRFFEGISRYPVASFKTGNDAVKMLVFLRDSLAKNPILLRDFGVQNVFFKYMNDLLDKIFKSGFVQSISAQQGRLDKGQYEENLASNKEQLKLLKSDFPIDKIVSFLSADINALIRLIVSAKGRALKAGEVEKMISNFLKNLTDASFSKPETIDAVLLQIDGFFGVFQSNLFFMKSPDVRKKLLDYLENRCRYLFNEFFFRKRNIFDLEAVKSEARELRGLIMTSNDIDLQKRLFSEFIDFIKEKISDAEVALKVEVGKVRRKKFTPTYLGLAGTLIDKASRTVKVISMIEEDDVAGMKDSMRFLRAKLSEVVTTLDRIRATLSLSRSDENLVDVFFGIVERFVEDLKKFESDIKKYSIKSLKQSIPKRFNAVLVGFKPVQDLFQKKVLV